jgi:hypothetical protein
MDLPPGWHLSIEDRLSPAARNRLGRELGKHNRPDAQGASVHAAADRRRHGLWQGRAGHSLV